MFAQWGNEGKPFSCIHRTRSSWKMYTRYVAAAHFVNDRSERKFRARKINKSRYDQFMAGSSNGEAKRKRKSINITFRLLVYVSIYYRSPNAKHYQAINLPGPGKNSFIEEKKKLSLHGTVKRSPNEYFCDERTPFLELANICLANLRPRIQRQDALACPRRSPRRRNTTTKKASASVMF